jgi:FkbM family methyltransferase
MYYSQDNQDRYLEQNVFKGFTSGVFVDVGAHDGVSLNNTLFFSKNRNWMGVNIEPIQKVFETLSKNRPDDINLPCAISKEDGEIDFLCNTGHTEMLSGIVSLYDPRHIERIKKENIENDSTSSVVRVKTRRLESIFDEYEMKHVHYLSIDVEGAEFEVIQSISFDKVFIDVIGFENNYPDTSIRIINHLTKLGYKVIHQSLDIFMIHKDSKFLF